MAIPSNMNYIHSYRELSIENLLNNLTRFLINCSVRMGDDSEEFLRELLTYDCPITGKKRVAGGNEGASEPTPKFLSRLAAFWGFIGSFFGVFQGSLNIMCCSSVKD